HSTRVCRAHPGRCAAALPPRLLQLRGTAPLRLALHHPHRAHQRHHHVVTGLAGTTGEVEYETAAIGAEGLEVRAVLRDTEGQEVACAAGARGVLTVDEVHPWRPGEGYLYELRVELWGGGDSPVDAYSLNVGVRTVSVDGNRFLINGEPFYFTGFGMHEDHVVRGKGHDDVSMVHDFALLDWTGATSFRTSHYPYAEEVL